MAMHFYDKAIPSVEEALVQWAHAAKGTDYVAYLRRRTIGVVFKQVDLKVLGFQFRLLFCP